MPKPTNINDVEWMEFGNGKTFTSHRKGLTPRMGGQGIGCSAFKVGPGKSAFPKHAHLANDEAIFVLKGKATMHMGDDTFEVKEGDYVPLPKGEAYAHRLVNTSDDDIEYLCLSTMIPVEVVFYPDSNKTGVFEVSDGQFKAEMYDRTGVDYWKGEDDD